MIQKKIGYSYAKEGNFTIILYNKQKTIQNKDLNKDLNLEISRRKHGSKLIDISLGNNLLDLCKSKNIPLGLHKTKELPVQKRKPLTK